MALADEQPPIGHAMAVKIPSSAQTIHSLAVLSTFFHASSPPSTSSGSFLGRCVLIDIYHQHARSIFHLR